MIPSCHLNTDFYARVQTKNQQEMFFLQRQTAFDRRGSSINATLSGDREWVNMAVLIRELEQSFLISSQWRCLKSRGDCEDDSCCRASAENTHALWFVLRAAQLTQLPRSWGQRFQKMRRVEHKTEVILQLQKHVGEHSVHTAPLFFFLSLFRSW